MPELDARIHAGEKVVEGKLPGQLAQAAHACPTSGSQAGDRVGSLEVVPTPGPQPRPRRLPRHA